MSGEAYHADGTPTGPRRAFPGWDFEVSRDGRGWRWHACDGGTIAGAGTSRTRTGARAAARLFAAAARWHRPRPAAALLVITLRSGERIEEPATVQAVRTHHLTNTLPRLAGHPGTARVRLHPATPAPSRLPTGVT